MEINMYKCEHCKRHHSAFYVCKLRDKKSVPVQSIKEKKPNKYRNIITKVDGIKFDSKREAIRYGELKMLENAIGAKKVSNLRLQVKYDIVINNIKICSYIADFVYLRDGKEIVEDVKGMRTAVYNIKKKLMKAVHNIEIFET